MNTNNQQKPKKKKNTPDSGYGINIENEKNSPVVSTFIKPVDQNELALAERKFGEAMVNYLGTKDINQAVRLMEKIIRTDPSPSYLDELHKIGLCTVNGEVDKAKLENLIGTSGLENAISDLNLVISLNPEYVDAYYNLGICYSETGRIDKSIEFFRRAIELDTDPKSQMLESAMFNLGNQFVIKRQYPEAIEQFEMILEKNPKLTDALYNAAYIYFKYLKDYDKAITYFEKTLKIFSLHLDARFNLGLCYYLKDNKEKAIEIWEQLVQVYSDYGPAYYNLALTTKELGRKDEARLFYQKYLEIPVKEPVQYLYAKHAKRRLKQLQEESKKNETKS